ncbi:bcl-2/adenovirus E1B 19 kDa-interacting protein 2-like protein isoform X1 [Anolis sagrei]|uniref:bcl-2/adenovirus E1B 19 kDa-interacting protein 2-like protein isoform X1 n=1 Tax=Anolis sagrei TaxID=38937 RepID=UPI003521D112
MYVSCLSRHIYIPETLSIVMIENSKSHLRGASLSRGSLPPNSRTKSRLKKETVTQGDESLNITDMELKEEWQDDGFPRPLPEEISGEDLEGSSSELSPVALNTLELCGRRHMKKRLPAPELGDGSVKSEEFPERTPDGSLDIDVDELETPSESELQESHGFEWDDDLPRVQRVDGDLGERFCTNRVTDIRDSDGRTWRIFLPEEQASPQRVDLSAVGPYKKVISHAGYDGEGLNAIIVFAACYLPDSSIPDYPYVMENLFMYFVGTLELMVAQNYTLVCLNGATPRSRLPSFAWIKQCYQTIDRRIRKNLKALVIVHPAWYVKALMAVFRPFISSKFSRKVQFVDSLADLARLIPLDQVHIPDPVRRLDQSRAPSQS